MNAVKNTYPAIRTLEGAGFEVRRPLPSAAIGSVGPFILLDHMGPTVVEPLKAVGAPTHPHAGIETITVIFEGGGHHKDSLGNVSTTGPGEVQWMRAGAGIIHDEGPSDEILKNGGRSHGAQLWLDMPGDKKFVAPDYRHLRLDDIPVLSSVGARASIIAGAQGDVFGPLKTYADPMLISAELAPETPFEFSLNPNYTYAVYGLLGEVLIGDENSIVREGELGVLADDLSVVVARAAEKRAHFLVIGGPPIENQIVRHGPFVANSVDHMHNIIHDYQMGKFGRIQ